MTTKDANITIAAATLGRKGGQVKSDRKAAAVRANARQPRRHIPAAVKKMLLDRGADNVRFCRVPGYGDDAIEAYGQMPNNNAIGWYFAGYLWDLTQEARALASRRASF